MRHESFAEFHNAHRIGWYVVIAKREFGNPEISTSSNSPDRKALFIWLDESALLDVVPIADLLARLRIIKHGILAVDFMLVIGIVGIRSTLVTLQREPHGSIIHFKSSQLVCRLSLRRCR